MPQDGLLIPTDATASLPALAVFTIRGATYRFYSVRGSGILPSTHLAPTQGHPGPISFFTVPLRRQCPLQGVLLSLPAGGWQTFTFPFRHPPKIFGPSAFSSAFSLRSLRGQCTKWFQPLACEPALLRYPRKCKKYHHSIRPPLLPPLEVPMNALETAETSLRAEE